MMRPWNLALRFVLEMAALVGLGLAAWGATTGVLRWVLVFLLPLAAAACWGTFNVVDDPSRSGRAPVEVAGWIRLLIELVVLFGGWIGYAIAGLPAVGVAFAALTVLHYAVGHARVRWLLGRRGGGVQVGGGRDR
ncbi:MAG TPA: YrdB family protein [Nitriliruptoraceae bacterium]|nr:YrdB family protein [Nitriliruptoraceae bacterium]